MMCGLMHFASKGKTISSTNPWSTHAVELAPKADPTTPRIPLGLWAIKVTGEGLNSKFASHGEKRLHYPSEHKIMDYFKEYRGLH